MPLRAWRAIARIAQVIRREYPVNSADAALTRTNCPIRPGATSTRDIPIGASSNALRNASASNGSLPRSAPPRQESVANRLEVRRGGSRSRPRVPAILASRRALLGTRSGGSVQRDTVKRRGEQQRDDRGARQTARTVGEQQHVVRAASHSKPTAWAMQERHLGHRPRSPSPTDPGPTLMAAHLVGDAVDSDQYSVACRRARTHRSNLHARDDVLAHGRVSAGTLA